MPDVLPLHVPLPVPPPTNGFLTLKEVAQRLHVSDRYVRGLRQSGALPVVPLGRRCLRVRPEDLDRYIEERMARPVRRRAAR